MHNSFFFLQQLSQELNHELRGFSIVSCFSQEKDELIIELNNGAKSFFIKAHLEADFCCLSFPSSFARAKKNSVDLLPEIILKKVLSARQFENERSFALILNDGFSLVFKMHGNRANVVLFEQETVIAIFRNHLKADLEMNFSSLDRPLEWSYPYFSKHQADLKKGFFTLGKECWEHLEHKGLRTLQPDDQWKLLQAFHDQLTNGKFFIIKNNAGVSLSLFPTEEVISQHTNAIKAVNEFFIRKVKGDLADHGLSGALKSISEKEKQTVRYIEKNKALLQSLQHEQQYQLWADLIMANLPEIKKGADSVILDNYKKHGTKTEVKLKRDLSPQKNAEEYYRKAKNQKIEIEKLSDSILQKEAELAKLLEQKEKLNRGESMTSTKNNATSHKKEDIRLPFKEVEFKGFIVRIGKGAKDNDELTLKYAHKEDLWLHAKDVSGSHVVVQHKSGKPFPKDVIERAAEIAAFHSKRKGESLCPVAVTTKKFVRKRKGDPAGLVVVENERVILVQPKG
jgi:predicted ribosome quality control (RQC) complex YloA/Tae2 family protein